MLPDSCRSTPEPRAIIANAGGCRDSRGRCRRWPGEPDRGVSGARSSRRVRKRKPRAGCRPRSGSRATPRKWSGAEFGARVQHGGGSGCAGVTAACRGALGDCSTTSGTGTCTAEPAPADENPAGSPASRRCSRLPCCAEWAQTGPSANSVRRKAGSWSSGPWSLARSR